LVATARRLFPDEFEREAVGLLASSGRPLSQITQELGIAPGDSCDVKLHEHIRQVWGKTVAL